ncbi:hypothetical protein RRG08_065747 [Elysia crispata]|uniref:Uncharacterized protein n=1 Tax=Elysia crispata TaxID=231223 RepID=A0AAE1DAR1_9GAST|nr:hypothetical protein RRG08_065747 [Elysia crispata]
MADRNSMTSEDGSKQEKKAMTSAERMRRYREKQKKMNPNFSSEESAQIERICEKRLADNPEAERLKSGETSAKHRSKKRKMETVSSATCTTTGGGFRSPQGLGKAVKRLQDVLPRSPDKRNYHSWICQVSWCPA